MYLAVSKEGQELIFEGRPIRRGRDVINSHIIYTQEINTNSIIGYDCIKDPYKINPIIGNFLNVTEWFNNGYFDNVLPKGTIKSIIGHDLSWEDQPIKIDTFEYENLARLCKLNGIKEHNKL